MLYLSMVGNFVLSFSVTLTSAVSGASGSFQKEEATDTSQHWGEVVHRVQEVSFHTCKQPSRSQSSYSTILLSNQWWPVCCSSHVVCRRGGTEKEEASRIKKRRKKRKSGSGRAEGTNKTKLCPTQNHLPPLRWAAIQRAPRASGSSPQGATQSAWGALLRQQPSDCTLPVVWIATTDDAGA